jgi:spore coat polysaccharide biosynthesis protein SpsF
LLAIVQARISSTRLPGKVLMPLLGEPMLLRQLERVSRASLLDGIVVATSTDTSDNAVQSVCAAAGYAVFRGSLDDVLDRFYRAAVENGAEDVVRLTADCPLTDPKVIDDVIRLHLDGGFDYTSNVMPPTFPDGLDIEVMRFGVLRDAWGEAHLPHEREHVTQFILQRPERFRLGCLLAERDLSGLRWTVDEPADYQFASAVYQRLYAADPSFGTEAVLALLEREPGLIRLNSGLRRNQGAGKHVTEEEGVSEQKGR